MRKKAQIIPRELKLHALARMEAGVDVSALARELKVRRKLLYVWRDRYRKLGPEGLRGPGRRPASLALHPRSDVSIPTPGEPDVLALSQQPIAELERKIGQQQLELDFFRAALRQVEGKQAVGAKRGAVPSTRSSKR
jgi:transposase-like protein